MREIKFRAWDKDRKCFLPCIVGNTDIKDDKWICPLTYCEIDGVYDWYHNDTCEIMQYTGLKDKNGKEIYEGDIVRDKDTNELCEVFWYNKGWYLKDKSGYYFGTFFEDEKEVIGNIWEISELLKGGSHE